MHDLIKICEAISFLFLFTAFTLSSEVYGHSITTLDVTTVVSIASHILKGWTCHSLTEPILNSNLSFLLDCLRTEAKEPSLLCYFTHSRGRKKRSLNAFPKDICAKVNATNSVGIWTRFADFTSRADNRYTTHIF